MRDGSYFVVFLFEVLQFCIFALLSQIINAFLFFLINIITYADSSPAPCACHLRLSSVPDVPTSYLYVILLPTSYVWESPIVNPTIRIIKPTKNKINKKVLFKDK